MLLLLKQITRLNSHCKQIVIREKLINEINNLDSCNCKLDVENDVHLGLHILPQSFAPPKPSVPVPPPPPPFFWVYSLNLYLYV